MNVFSKVFGTRSQREVKRIMPLVEKTESYQSQMQQLTDEQLRDKTREYKKRLAEGATLDDLLPEAFATVREAAKRVLGMEHYRVQIIGGIILHQGRIAEMKTGEGKTLVSTLPAYLNALEGKGVHIVTVNDYLAKRDAEWMGKVHEFKLHLRWAIRIFLKKIKILLLKIKKLHFSPLICQTLHTLVLNFYLDLKKR